MFSAVLTSVYNLAAAGILAGLPVYPSDYKGEVASVPFLYLSVIFPEASLQSYAGDKKLAGMIVISLYSPSGEGQSLAAGIAGQLNLIFEKKSLTGGITTGVSSLQFLGADKENSSLSRADYSVPFSYYGV